MLVVVTLGLFFICWPYIGAIFWGVVLAIVFEPVQTRVLARWPRHRTAASLATLMIVVAGVVLPITVVATLVWREAAGLYAALASGRVDVGAAWQRSAGSVPPWLAEALDKAGVGDLAALQSRLSAGALEARRFVAAHVVRLGIDSFGFALSVAVMLYLLFFLLRDGHALVARLDRAVPLAEVDKLSLRQTFVTVIRATVKGGAVMAAVQGTLGGLVLGAMGVPAPLLWGVVFGLASMLPAVGAGLLWVPITLYFVLVGALAKAFWLTLFGSVALTVVDNVLRPLLVGRDTHLPGYLVLISTLGGVASLGLNGVVIGPVVAAMFMTAWSLFSPHAAAPPVDAGPARR